GGPPRDLVARCREGGAASSLLDPAPSIITGPRRHAREHERVRSPCRPADDEPRRPEGAGPRRPEPRRVVDVRAVQRAEIYGADALAESRQRSREQALRVRLEEHDRGPA